MILGITGTNGAGKGTVVGILKKKGFSHLSVREFLSEEIKKRNLPLNRDSMFSVANELRAKHSPSYIVERLYEKAEGNCIIESVRTPGEVFALKKKGSFLLISVDADPKIRYERIIKRGSVTDNLSFEEFVEDEQREMSSDDPAKQNISKCLELADFKLINNSSKKLLEKQVEKIIEQILK
jgi:dephospho-CoA kinase